MDNFERKENVCVKNLQSLIMLVYAFLDRIQFESDELPEDILDRAYALRVTIRGLQQDYQNYESGNNDEHITGISQEIMKLKKDCFFKETTCLYDALTNAINTIIAPKLVNLMQRTDILLQSPQPSRNNYSRKWTNWYQGKPRCNKCHLYGHLRRECPYWNSKQINNSKPINQWKLMFYFIKPNMKFIS